MTDKNVLSTLKAQWVILKDTGASNKDRVAAYKMIELLQQQHEGEEGFKTFPLQETRYKIFESIERANSAPSSSQKEQPATQASSYKPAVKVDYANFEFVELTGEDQEATEKSIRRFFERKVIAMKVANEPQFLGLGFDNVASVGQAAGETN